MVSIANVKYTAKETGVRPSFAVVFYESCSDKTIVSATRHQVNKNNTLSIGRVISASQICNTFSDLNVGKDRSSFECFPESVLYESADLLVWYKKRFVGDMWFRLGKNPERLVVEWPPLLFIARKASPCLRVFALGSNKRPTKDTKLYHAPLMNIDAQGRLCQGTATLPRQITIGTISRSEETLLESQFTHVNHEHTLKIESTNSKHFAFWKAKSKKRKSPAQRVKVSELADTNCRLENIFKGTR